MLDCCSSSEISGAEGHKILPSAEKPQKLVLLLIGGGEAGDSWPHQTWEASYSTTMDGSLMGIDCGQSLETQGTIDWPLPT